MKRILYLGLDPTRYPHEGELVHFPIIRVVPRPFEGEIKTAFAQLPECSHVLFTSRTAVSLFLTYTDFEQRAGKTYICVGQGTDKRLAEARVHSAHVAEEETGEGVVALLKTLTIPSLFFPRSAQGRFVIQRYLREAAIPFISVDLYDTLPNPLTLPDLELFDAVVFTSPSTVHAFCTLAPLPPPENCISIGPITTKALEDEWLATRARETLDHIRLGKEKVISWDEMRNR